MHLRPREHLNTLRLLLIMTGVVVVGIAVVLVVFGSSSPIAFETEAGMVTNPAMIHSSTGASGGSGVKFGSSSPLPLYERAYFGAFASEDAAQMPYGDGLEHARLEQLVGAKFKEVSIFAGWGEGINSNALATGSSGHNLLIAWDAQYQGGTMKFADVLAGKYDTLMRNMFLQAKSYSGTVTYRPFWEFNAAGGPTSVAYGGADRSVTSTEQWIATWRYIVNFQRTQVPTSNIKWFWCANGSDVAGPNGSYTME